MKKKYHQLLLWGILPALIFLALFIFPAYTLPFDVSLLLTVTSLIFGVFMAFFIGTATTNYIYLNLQLAEANSLLTVVYNLVKLLDVKTSEKVADIIDKYLIATLEYSLMNHAKNTEKEFNQIIDSIDSVDIKNGDSKASVLFQNLHTAKSDLFKKRQTIVQLAPRVITSIHWAVILLLTGIIVSLLFSLRTGDYLSNAFFGMVITSFYLLLVVLYQIDSDEFLEKQLAYEDIQLVFKSIGKLRYYPATVLENNLAHKPKEAYRVGSWEEGKQKVVQREA